MKLAVLDSDTIAPVVYDWGAVKWVVNEWPVEAGRASGSFTWRGTYSADSAGPGLEPLVVSL